MPVCVICGVEIQMIPFDKEHCSVCSQIVDLFPAFIRKDAGFKWAFEQMVKAQEEQKQAAEAQKVREREMKILAAMEGQTVASLRRQIAQKRTILGQMVGTLYPAILEAEIDILEEASQRLICDKTY